MNREHTIPGARRQSFSVFFSLPLANGASNLTVFEDVSTVGAIANGRLKKL
jgi:hypothetical protein